MSTIKCNYYTQGDADECIANVGLTSHQEVVEGFYTAREGNVYKRTDYASAEDMAAYLNTLYRVPQVEGFVSPKGFVQFLDYMADRHQYFWDGYNAWKATEFVALEKVSPALAEREAKRLFGGIHGQWVTPERYRAGDLNLGTVRLRDNHLLTRTEQQTLAAETRKGGVRR